MTTHLAATGGGSIGYDDHVDESQEAQREADKWMIGGTILMGTAVLGIFGLPLFLRGLSLQRNAQRRASPCARSS